MLNNYARKWFEDSFDELSPLLQKLHVHGGQLTGPVFINIPTGATGFIGQKIAKKLGIPINKGSHSLQVEIKHSNDGLHWNRCFDGINKMESVFKPIGKKSNGYWIETTGTTRLKLTVDIKDGGWYWRVLEAKVRGIKIPLWLFPKTNAYKIIEDDSYRFYVGFSVPLLGEVLSYSGLLQAELNQQEFK